MRKISLTQQQISYIVDFRLRPQTKFFYAWSWSTAAFLFLEYELGVVGLASLPRTVSFWENLVLVCSACCAAASLAWAKRRAGRDLIRAGEEDEEIKKREGPRRGSARWCKGKEQQNKEIVRIVKRSLHL